MTSDTELIAKLDTIRSIFREVFINGYRSSSELYGKKGTLPIKHGDYYSQINNLKNFLGSELLIDTRTKKVMRLSIGAARASENPLHMLLKTHSIKYERLALHLSLMAGMEKVWHDRLSNPFDYRIDEKQLKALGQIRYTKTELYSHICRQLNSGAATSWSILQARVDGQKIGGDKAEMLLLKQITRQQYDELFKKATQNAQRNGSALMQLPDGWQLIAIDHLFLCYRHRNGRRERMDAQQLKQYWESQPRNCTYEELLKASAARCENRRTGRLRPPAPPLDELIPLDSQRILIYRKGATPALRIIKPDQLRQECNSAEYEALREILLDIWTDYCHGSATVNYNGHDYTLEVAWSDAVNPPFTLKVLTDYLPSYVNNGLILCVPKTPYRYSPSPMRPHLYGQGLFELYPGLEKAVAFFSEVSPLGAFGSQIMDQAGLTDRPFVFRDRYYAQLADSLLLFDILESIRRHQVLNLETDHYNDYSEIHALFQPMCILSDLHQGRQYLYGYNLTKGRYASFRLDLIRSAVPDLQAVWSQERAAEGLQLLSNAWSNRVRTGQPLQLTMTLDFHPEDEVYFYHRVDRERRIAKVSDPVDGQLQLNAQVWDPREMMPWTLSMTGRISNLRSTKLFTDRFRQHIECMQERYNSSHKAGTLPFAQADREYTPSPVDPDKTHTVSPLFLDFASRYIICCQHILKAFAGRRFKTADAQREIERIAKTYGFARTATPDIPTDNHTGTRIFEGISLPPLLRQRILRREQVNGEEYISSNIHIVPERPFTFGELRWLLTILQDRRMPLFMSADQIAEARQAISDFLRSCSDALAGYDPSEDAGEEETDAAKQPKAKKATKKAARPKAQPPADVVSEPLYTPETYIEQGICHDSDPYGNELYQMHFAQLTTYICSGTAASVTYRPTKRSSSRTVPLWPLKLEYSSMRDKLYLIARTTDGRYINIRLSSINSVDHIEYGDAPDEADRGSWEDYLQHTSSGDEEVLDVIVSSESNAIERFLLEFSVYRKVAERIGHGDTFRVKVWYLKSDTSEMIVKLLRYGRTIEVLGPEPVRSEIARRVEKQYGLLKTALPPVPPSTPPAAPEA